MMRNFSPLKDRVVLFSFVEKNITTSPQASCVPA